jgi:hypothetical protein
MYCLEGEVTVRRDPETLLGQYGCLYVTERPTVSDGVPGTHQSTVMRTGDEDYVITARELLIEAGEMPVDTPVEQITSVEQAEKYTPAGKQKLQVVKRRIPGLGELLDSSVPKGIELLEGEARLWKDRRYPTPYVYFLAHGALLAEVEFDREQGWHHVHSEVEGSRTIRGIGTPVFHNTRTGYSMLGRTRNGYRFSETKEEGTSRSRGYHVSVSFHIGKTPAETEQKALPELDEGSIIQDHEGTTYVVNGFTILADKWEKKRKLAAGVKYQRLDETGQPIGDEHTRAKREILHGATKHDGARVPLFTVEASKALKSENLL